MLISFKKIAYKIWIVSTLILCIRWRWRRSFCAKRSWNSSPSSSKGRASSGRDISTRWSRSFISVISLIYGDVNWRQNLLGRYLPTSIFYMQRFLWIYSFYISPEQWSILFCYSIVLAIVLKCLFESILHLSGPVRPSIWVQSQPSWSQVNNYKFLLQICLKFL